MNRLHAGIPYYTKVGSRWLARTADGGFVVWQITDIDEGGSREHFKINGYTLNCEETQRYKEVTADDFHEAVRTKRVVCIGDKSKEEYIAGCVKQDL